VVPKPAVEFVIPFSSDERVVPGITVERCGYRDRGVERDEVVTGARADAQRRGSECVGNAPVPVGNEPIIPGLGDDDRLFPVVPVTVSFPTLNATVNGEADIICRLSSWSKTTACAAPTVRTY